LAEFEKNIIIVAICLIVLAVAFVFLSPFLIPKPMESVLNVDFNKVDKITIGDGMNGNSCVLTDKSSTEEFLDRFGGAMLRKSFDQRKYTGFAFSANLYESDKKVCGYNFGSNIITVWNGNNSVRYVLSGNMDSTQTDEIEKYYKLES
jgi:hypothetical protein